MYLHSLTPQLDLFFILRSIFIFSFFLESFIYPFIVVIFSLIVPWGGTVKIQIVKTRQSVKRIAVKEDEGTSGRKTVVNPFIRHLIND